MNIIKKYIDIDVNNFNEMINLVACDLSNLGYVKKSFQKNIIKREENFPTGLELEHLNVAIPHTDAEHVNDSGIVFVETKKTIKMIAMGTNQRKIDVQYFFILLVSISKMQVDVLTNLIAKLKSHTFIKLLKTNTSKIDKYFKK